MRKRSGLYDITVRNSQGLEFTMRDACWDSFVPVLGGKQTAIRPTVKQHLTLVDGAVEQPTQKYLETLKKVYQKHGLHAAFMFDLDVTIERLVNMQYFRS